MKQAAKSLVSASLSRLALKELAYIFQSRQGGTSKLAA
jgi:hypothetical protein